MKAILIQMTCLLALLGAGGAAAQSYPDKPIEMVVPGNAGAAAMQLEPGGLLPPWAGIAVATGYALLVLAVGALVLRRRDA